MDVANATFDCSRTLALRLVNGGGQDIFNKALEFKFSPYDVTLAEQGVEATVESVVDYGAETFAVCKVGDAVINVSVPKDFAEQSVKLALDVDKLAIIETARAIRLA